MAPKRGAAPHAAHQLDLLAGKVTDAHAAIATAAVTATVAAIARTAAAREVKTQRRADRLAAIEERNKHAASHPVDHPGG